jgi:hypothetical protein
MNRLPMMSNTLANQYLSRRVITSEKKFQKISMALFN